MATETDSKPAPQRRKAWIWLVFWAIVLVAGWHYRNPILAWWNQKPAAATATTGGGGGGGGRGRGGTGPVPVVVARAVRGSIPVYLRGIGTVSAAYTVTVTPRVSGQILRVDFQEGQMVHQGDLLVEIDPAPYQVALEQAQGQLAHDQALEADAKIDQARYEALYQDQVIAKQQLDTQVATVNEYAGAIASDQAAIDNAKLNLSWCKITSPINGRIGLRLVDPGNVVQTTSTTGLAVITQVQPIAVLFSLPQEQLPQVYALLRNGEHPAVTAYDSTDTKEIAEGRLLTINNQIDPTTGTYQLKAMFDNADNALFPNQFVNMRLSAGAQTGLTIIPPAAIQRGPQGTYVFVIAPPKPNGARSTTVRNVTVALTEGNQAGIKDGLQPGDEVVIDGADKLEQGTRVAVSYAPASPAGAAPATAVADDPPAAAAANADPPAGALATPAANPPNGGRRHTGRGNPRGDGSRGRGHRGAGSTRP